MPIEPSGDSCQAFARACSFKSWEDLSLIVRSKKMSLKLLS